MSGGHPEGLLRAHGGEVRPLDHLAQTARRIGASAPVMLCVVSGVTAQTVEVAATATIHGVVRGEMSRLLPDAEVFLDSDSMGVRNDAKGQFRFLRVREGQYWLFVRRIGYAPTRRLLTVVGGEDLAIEVQLERLPWNLPEIEVRARSGYRDFDQFMQRTRNAWGYAVSEDQIRRLGNMGLSRLVRARLPWQATSWADQARRDVIELTDFSGAPYSASRYGPPHFPVPPVGIDGYGQGWFGVTGPLTGSDRPGRRPGGYSTGLGFSVEQTGPGPILGAGCAPAVSINGEKPSYGTHLDDIAPGTVASMEIYESKRRGGRVPVDFEFDAQVTNCGLVVVWLR